MAPAAASGDSRSGRRLRTRAAAPTAASNGARCRHEGVCGGCGWQAIDYPEQRRRKRSILQTHLDQVLGAAAPRVLPVLAPDGDARPDAPAPWGFRHKVHFVCAPGPPDSPVVLGHYASGGQRVVGVEECPVHAEAGNQLAWRIGDACRQAGVMGATPDGRAGLLRHVVIRVGRATHERLVTLVVTNTADTRLRRLTALLTAGPDAPDGIHVNLLRGRSSWLFGPETRKVHGRAWLREEVAGVSFLVAPAAFFQTNLTAAETLVRLVLDAVPQDATDVLDLYAGVGLFALPLARRGHRVIAVEEHPEAVAAGRRSCALNGIEPRTCSFVCARSDAALDRLIDGAAHRDGRRWGHASDTAARLVVVVDPPRAGLSARLVDRLFRDACPAVIVYVSCEPATLARDVARGLSAAREAGVAYRLDRVQPLDMFPHTPHLEAVAVLSRAAGGVVPHPRRAFRRHNGNPRGCA
jgi:23S rRNA (uracil1939-C5)-methyltransferase